jgi:hypothetical protein
MIAPHHDAPDCPNHCGDGTSGLATPIVSAEIERWEGPGNATLFCPGCGAGWVGTAGDVARAEASWRAWAAELAARAVGDGFA